MSARKNQSNTAFLGYPFKFGSMVKKDGLLAKHFFRYIGAPPKLTDFAFFLGKDKRLQVASPFPFGATLASGPPR